MILSELWFKDENEQEILNNLNSYGLMSIQGGCTRGAECCWCRKDHWHCNPLLHQVAPSILSAPSTGPSDKTWISIFLLIRNYKQNLKVRFSWIPWRCMLDIDLVLINEGNEGTKFFGRILKKPTKESRGIQKRNLISNVFADWEL